MGRAAQVEIWADGACLGNPGPGGWGAVLRSPDGREKELSGGEAKTTNNRMELLGAIVALEALKRPVKVVVRSDSQYVVRGMSEWIDGWRRKGWKKVMNRDLWERLSAAAEPHEVRWEWVRGHAGDPMNERCDALAVAAAEAWKKGKGAPTPPAPAGAAPAPAAEAEAEAEPEPAAAGLTAFAVTIVAGAGRRRLAIVVAASPDEAVELARARVPGAARAHGTATAIEAGERGVTLLWEGAPVE